jgi:hypothetical protein
MITAAAMVRLQINEIHGYRLNHADTGYPLIWTRNKIVARIRTICPQNLVYIQARLSVLGCVKSIFISPLLE